MRQRLIETAGEVFGELGFEHGTIRDIAARAGVGVGVVHYYFEDKADLYRAICKYAVSNSLSSYENAIAETSDAKLQLYRWIDVFLNNTFSGQQPAWQGKLVLRGMTEPGPGAGEFVKTLLRPHHDLLLKIYQKLLAPANAREIAVEHIFVLFGQCILHHHMREVAGQLRGKPYTEADIEHLRDRILMIVFAGIEAERERYTKTNKRAAGNSARRYKK